LPGSVAPARDGRTTGGPGRMMATLAVAIAVVGIATHRLMPPGTLTARPGQARLVAAEGLMGGHGRATDIYLTNYVQGDLGYPTDVGGSGRRTRRDRAGRCRIAGTAPFVDGRDRLRSAS